MTTDPAHIALSVANSIPAMMAYWDADQRCHFSNDAYREWFGRSPEEMKGMHLRDLLGEALYRLNLPYIQGALRGEKQVFERRIPRPDGGVRDSIATYTPDIVGGVVMGFSVHVADVTPLREREAALEVAIRQRDEALAEVRTLRGLLPICSFCKDIRDASGNWHQFEAYIVQHSDAQFSHGVCPSCTEKHYGHILKKPSS